MEQKILMNFIGILTYRRDLIDIIKPFMENLENHKTNETFHVQDKENLPFLKLLDAFQLEFLHKFEIINDNTYRTLVPNPKDSSKTLTPDEQLVSEIIKKDKYQELQRLINEKGINSINTISTSFLRMEKMSIPILVYTLIHNATKCFKYLLLNGEDPRKIMEEQNPDMNNKNWKSFHRFEWDCMATAIFYGRVELIKILEENGIEKGENANHIETAILSFRNPVAKHIIEQIKEKDQKKIQKLLDQGLIASAKNNNIKGAEYLINQGANINGVNRYNHILIFLFLIKTE